MNKNNELANQINFNLILFKRVFIIISLYIIAIDIIILLISFSSSIFREALYSIFPFLYPLFIISLIVKLGFEVYEILRFIRFLKLKHFDKEGAYKLAEAFLGTKIIRIYYLVVLVLIIVFLEIVDFQLKAFGDSPYRPPYDRFFSFYIWFSILLALHILPLMIGAHVKSFSIDTGNKENKIKIITYSILFIFIIILLFNVDIIFRMLAGV